MSFKDELINAAKQLQFSGAVMIFTDDKALFHEAFGFADRVNLIKNKTTTRFGCASGTKFLTALGIGKLIDQDKLTLDTKMLDILPYKFPNYSRDITIHHLLTHTSGVFDYYDEELIDDFDNFQVSIPWYNIRNLEDYLPLLQDGEMKFKPGSRVSYSNSGYILLGLIIETISKMSYQNFIQKNIFDECKMTESGFFALNMLPENTAIGYIKLDDNNWKSNVYNLPIIGGSDGGAFITTGDIQKLWKAFLSNKILSEDLSKLFCTPQIQITEKNPNKFYGYGLYITKISGGKKLGFLGEDAGVGFYSEYNLVNRTGFTVVSNDSESYWNMKIEIQLIKRFSLYIT